MSTPRTGPRSAGPERPRPADASSSTPKPRGPTHAPRPVEDVLHGGPEFSVALERVGELSDDDMMRALASVSSKIAGLQAVRVLSHLTFDWRVH